MKCSPLGRSDFGSDREYQQWALVMLELYQSHADQSFRDAENAAAVACRLKEEGELATMRARDIAKALAQFLDRK